MAKVTKYTEAQEREIRTLQDRLFGDDAPADHVVIDRGDSAVERFALVPVADAGDAKIVGRREWRCYQNGIARMGCGDLKPRWVEAFMRTQYGTLNHLDAETFRREIELTETAFAEYGSAMLDSMADSQGV